MSERTVPDRAPRRRSHLKVVIRYRLYPQVSHSGGPRRGTGIRPPDAPSWPPGLAELDLFTISPCSEPKRRTSNSRSDRSKASGAGQSVTAIRRQSLAQYRQARGAGRQGHLRQLRCPQTPLGDRRAEAPPTMEAPFHADLGAGPNAVKGVVPILSKRRLARCDFNASSLSRPPSTASSDDIQQPKSFFRTAEPDRMIAAANRRPDAGI